MNKSLEYEVLDHSSTASVSIRFMSVFNHQQIVWNAHIHTLQDKFNRNQYDKKQYAIDGGLKQSIEISGSADSYNIEITLNLSEINAAAIKRTMIMIRKYKNLHLGSHYFGEVVTF